MGLVFSANTGISADNNENKSINEKFTENEVFNSNITKISSTNDLKITVSHNKVEHGKPISFKGTVKDSKGNPVIDHYFAFNFRSKNDKTNHDGRFTNTVFLQIKMVFSLNIG
ncbi:hypothetical protein ALNOE001_16950 [Candidatus Methanobinarius endosymbioticus]|uniref:Uncharacterized protein n=1 Tax=Candidatus Methanobinarius endosymbioticus TaxID=2006182 RepID=A0A366M9B3_9EURY|nr:hypothetical protein ALNOE001_16950 [Candidatus Methanobinarius endosymbioticus]